MRIGYGAPDPSTGVAPITYVELPPGTDVVVMQRVTERRLLDVITWLRANGIAVVIDVDDDLAAIHPANPAFTFLDPNRAKHEVEDAIKRGEIKDVNLANRAHAMLSQKYTHSWRNLSEACRRATLVTVSTPGLLRRYAVHGRGVVLPNYVPEHYLQVEHVDSDLLGWPAALHSHPNDPSAVGNALARLVADGTRFVTIGDSEHVDHAFGLRDYQVEGAVAALEDWPHALGQLGVAIVPLADTLFNSRKSWLKPLELSATGVPWVASPRAEYAKLHKMGAGLLADKPRTWYAALRSLLDDPARRADLSAAGREVAGQLRLVDHAYEYAEAWQHALDLEHREPENALALSGT